MKTVYHADRDGVPGKRWEPWKGTNERLTRPAHSYALSFGRLTESRRISDAGMRMT